MEARDYRMIQHPHATKRLIYTIIGEDVPHIHFMGLMQSLYGIDSESVRNIAYSIDGIDAEFTCNKGRIKCKVETSWMMPDVESTIEKSMEFKFKNNGSMSVTDVPYKDGTSELLFDGDINERVKVPDKLGWIVNNFFDSLSDGTEPIASLSNPEIRKIHLDTLVSVTPEFLRRNHNGSSQIVSA